MPAPNFYSEECSRPPVNAYPPNGELPVAYAAPLRRKCLPEFKLPALLQDIAIKVAKRVCK